MYFIEFFNSQYVWSNPSKMMQLVLLLLHEHDGGVSFQDELTRYAVLVEIRKSCHARSLALNKNSAEEI